jgi:hypothetical protein
VVTRVFFTMSANIPQIDVVADLRSEKLSAKPKQRYENNIQNQDGDGNKANLLLATARFL